jgi:hypothetical protein
MNSPESSVERGAIRQVEGSLVEEVTVRRLLVLAPPLPWRRARAMQPSCPDFQAASRNIQPH